MHTSTITEAEAKILVGIALLPASKCRTSLADVAELMFAQDFAVSCLDFDAAAAKNYAVLVAARIRQWLPISTEDAQIAAIEAVEAVNNNQKQVLVYNVFAKYGRNLSGKYLRCEAWPSSPIPATCATRPTE